MNFLTGIGLAVVFFGLSYLIWRKKMLSLIIGYSDQTFFCDKDKLAKRVGIITSMMGILSLLVPILEPIFGLVINYIYIGAIIFLAILGSLFHTLPYFQIK